MEYRHPSTVDSPKDKISDLQVICDRGKERYSVAIMKWENNDNIGVRWNGKNNELGNPQSSGNPTWFILPHNIAVSYLKSKLNDPDIADLAKRIQAYIDNNDNTASN